MVTKFLVVDFVGGIRPKPIVSSFDVLDILFGSGQRVLARDLGERCRKLQLVTGHALWCAPPYQVASHPLGGWSIGRRVLTLGAIIGSVKRDAGASLVWRLYEDRVHEDTELAHGKTAG